MRYSIITVILPDLPLPSMRGDGILSGTEDEPFNLTLENIIQLDTYTQQLSQYYLNMEKGKATLNALSYI